MGGSWGRVGLVFALLAASCGAPPREPRPIHPDSDVCAECRMTVVSEGHAAESVDSEGQVLVFDDPGCLALYVQDHAQEFVGAAFFVEDASTKAWVPWEDAVFVNADVTTPMNYGWHAFSDQTRAQAFAEAHRGTVTTKTTLAALAADLEDKRWRP